MRHLFSRNFLLVLYIGVAAAQSSPTPGPPFLFYEIKGSFSPGEQPPTSQIDKVGCAGTLPPVSVFDPQSYPPLPACSSGLSISDTEPFTATYPTPGSINANTSVNGDIGILQASSSASVTGDFSAGGEGVDVILYRPDVPTGLQPGAQFQFLMSLDSSPNPANQPMFAYYSLQIRLISDTNEVDYYIDSYSPAPQNPIAPPLLTIGPSGHYTLHLVLSEHASANGPLNIPSFQNASQQVKLAMCVGKVDLSILSPGPVYPNETNTVMHGEFTPYSGSLQDLAMACGFLGFNWQQTIDTFPLPSPSNMRANSAPNSPLSAPPSFSDPPQGLHERRGD